MTRATGLPSGGGWTTAPAAAGGVRQGGGRTRAHSDGKSGSGRRTSGGSITARWVAVFLLVQGGERRTI